MNQSTPNPGSNEAVEHGCTCPVMDNAHGLGMPSRDGPQFWISGGCPIHAPKELREACQRAEQDVIKMRQEQADE